MAINYYRTSWRIVCDDSWSPWRHTAASDAAVLAAQVADLEARDLAGDVVPSPAVSTHSEAPTAEIAQEPLAERLDPATVKAQIAANLELIGSDPEEQTPDASDLPAAELRGALESLLLVATKPLTTERIAALLPGTATSYLDGFLRGMADRAEQEQRGWMIASLAGGWQFVTRERFHPWVRQLDKKELPSKLSRSAMETLAIIAYKQPISRGQIDDIRGVQSGPMVRQLMDLKLVHVAGRSEDLLGKPLLYGTTQVFCDRLAWAALTTYRSNTN